MKQLLWFPVLLAVLRPATSIRLHEITDMVEVVIKTLPLFIHEAEAFYKEEDGPSMPIKSDLEERELLGRLKQVEHQLERVYQQSAEATRHAALILNTLPDRLRLELQLSELEKLLSKIRVVDNQLQEYVMNGWDNETNTWLIERVTVEDLAFSIVSHREGSVRAALDRLDDLLRGSFHGSTLLHRLARTIGEGESSEITNVEQYFRIKLSMEELSTHSTDCKMRQSQDICREN